MANSSNTPKITGRCYCGETTFTASQAPKTVVYCHCVDCRRVTGAPVAAFAAFDAAAVTFSPDDGRNIASNPGVRRSFCAACGSPLAGRYDYLPGAVYVPIGLIDQAEDFPPERHAHFDQRLNWLHIEDELEQHDGSARNALNK